MRIAASQPIVGLFVHSQWLSDSFILAPATSIKLSYISVDRSGIIRRFAFTKRTDASLDQSP
jgi:hypothetical protein